MSLRSKKKFQMFLKQETLICANMKLRHEEQYNATWIEYWKKMRCIIIENLLMNSVKK
jgi:hypothetical protein